MALPEQQRGWLTERPRPAWLRERPTAYRYALATVCIGAFMGQLDASIVTVAFPTLQRSFDASLGAVTWVGLSYLVVLIAGVTAVGRLADMTGRKLLYTYGFVVFIAGSALCGLAPSLPALDAFRAVQAGGAAMLQANSVAILYLALPKDRLGRGIGIQGAAQAAGLALGPTVGGLLLAAGGWRLIFFVNVPAGVIGVLAAWLFLPRSRDLSPRSVYDWHGLALFVPAIGAFLVALSFGDSWGWGSSATITLFVVAVTAAAAFVRRERRAPAPMLDPSLFSRPGFSAGVLSALLSFVALFGTMFVIPFFLERSHHLGAAQAGLRLTVLPLVLAIVAPIAGRLSDKTGPRLLAVCGMALVAVGLCAFALTLPAGWLLVVELGVVGAGLGLFTAPNTASVMAAVPRNQAGVASGVFNMSRGLGTALGLALTGLVLGTAASSSTAGAEGSGSGVAAAALLLAGIAGLAAVLSATRRASHRRRLRRVDPASPEALLLSLQAGETRPSTKATTARTRVAAVIHVKAREVSR